MSKHTCRVAVALSLKGVVEVSVSGDDIEATIVEGVRIFDQCATLPSVNSADLEASRETLEAMADPEFSRMLSVHALLLAVTAARDMTAKLVGMHSRPSVAVVGVPTPRGPAN